ncbi:MAG: c-type cytochrome [Rubrimonas sp.]
MTMRAALALMLLTIAPTTWAAELRGHGGPVRALDASGGLALTGSFDSTAIVWSAHDGQALRVLRHHAGGVTAVALLPEGYATGGEDGRIALWRDGEERPVAEPAAHAGPVAALAVSPDGRWLASAGWDGVARLIPLAAGAEIALPHGEPVNAVAFLPDGRVATAAQDLTLRVWSADGRLLASTRSPSPQNALTVAGERIVSAGADATVRFYDADLTQLAEARVEGGPIVGLAASADGSTVAASSVTGAVTVLDAAGATVRLAIAEVGPVWSVAFADDGATLLAGGGDRVVRRWDAATGAALDRADLTTPALDAGLDESRGAQVFRACAACHTLGPDDGHRAGPTLHAIFGRRIGSAEGYDYSEALRTMDIVWTPETVSKLFEVGPAAYTPGTKMPEQRIGSAEDRAALMEFLARNTQ